MSTYFTIPAGHGLVARQKARAEDVLDLFNRVDSGFDFLPATEVGALPGFTEVFTIQTPVLNTHPATKLYVDGATGNVFASQAEVDAGVVSDRVIAPDTLNLWPGSAAITTLGTVPSLVASAITVDNLSLDGNTISSTSGALNITPVGGAAIVLDSTISIDGGVVTGATAITSTAFTGTLQTAAQPNVTSLGTLTSLTVDNITINGAVISSDTGAISFLDENLVTTGTLGAGASTFSGILSVDSTQDSSSTTTGSIHTDGGLGVALEQFNGGDIHPASGKGIDFSAAGGGVFSVYDPTSYSPTLTCVSSGSYTFAASGDTLAYTTIGRVVFVQGALVIASETSPSGRLRLSLPLVVTNLTDGQEAPAIPIVIDAHGDAGIENSVLIPVAGQSYCELYNITDTGGLESIDESRVDTAFNISVSFMYISA